MLWKVRLCARAHTNYSKNRVLSGWCKWNLFLAPKARWVLIIIFKSGSQCSRVGNHFLFRLWCLGCATPSSEIHLSKKKWCLRFFSVPRVKLFSWSIDLFGSSFLWPCFVLALFACSSFYCWYCLAAMRVSRWDNGIFIMNWQILSYSVTLLISFTQPIFEINRLELHVLSHFVLSLFVTERECSWTWYR